MAQTPGQSWSAGTPCTGGVWGVCMRVKLCMCVCMRVYICANHSQQVRPAREHQPRCHQVRAHVPACRDNITVEHCNVCVCQRGQHRCVCKGRRAGRVYALAGTAIQDAGCPRHACRLHIQHSPASRRASLKKIVGGCLCMKCAPVLLPS